MVMGFGPPEGDPEVWAALEAARKTTGDDVCAAGLGRVLISLRRTRTILLFIRK